MRKNRLLIAKILSKPSNVIVLDEPTNDLDIETLEILEDMLMNYQGTILMVSHDREFINNIATNSIVFENGEIEEFLGGYDDWIAQRKPEVEVSKKPKSNKNKSKNMPKIEAKSKLSQDQRKLLRNIPVQIEKLEESIKVIDAQMSEVDFYKKPEITVKQTQKKSDDLNSELLEKYETWELLLSME